MGLQADLLWHDTLIYWLLQEAPEERKRWRAKNFRLSHSGITTRHEKPRLDHQNSALAFGHHLPELSVLSRDTRDHVTAHDVISTPSPKACLSSYPNLHCPLHPFSKIIKIRLRC